MDMVFSLAFISVVRGFSRPCKTIIPHAHQAFCIVFPVSPVVGTQPRPCRFVQHGLDVLSDDTRCARSAEALHLLAAISIQTARATGGDPLAGAEVLGLHIGLLHGFTSHRRIGVSRASRSVRVIQHPPAGGSARIRSRRGLACRIRCSDRTFCWRRSSDRYPPARV